MPLCVRRGLTQPLHKWERPGLTHVLLQKPEELFGVLIEVIVTVKAHTLAEWLLLIWANPDHNLLCRARVRDDLHIIHAGALVYGVLVALDLRKEHGHLDAGNVIERVREGEAELL